MKSNIIQNIQHLASKLFNKEVSKMHYSTKRLSGFTMDQLLDTEKWFKKENDKILTIKNQIKYNGRKTMEDAL